MMNIIYAGNPLILMSQDARKKVGEKTRAAAPDIPDMLSARPPVRELARYLKCIDDIVSDLLSLVSDHAQTDAPGGIPVEMYEGPAADDVQGEGGGNIPVTVGRSAPAFFTDETAGNTLYRGGFVLYFPPSRSGTEDPGPGRTVVVPGGWPYPGENVRLGQDWQVSQTVKDARVQLSALHEGIGLKAADLQATPVPDRYIAFVETKGDRPSVSIIRQPSSGKPEILDEYRVGQERLPDLAATLNMMASGTELSRAPLAGGDETGIPAGIERDDRTGSGNAGMVRPSGLWESVAGFVSSALSGPVRTEPGPADAGGEIPVHAQVVNGFGNEAAPDVLTGAPVVYIDKPLPVAPRIEGDLDRRVVDRMTELAGHIRNIPEFLSDSGTLSAEEITEAEGVTTAVREQVPAMVRHALHAASLNSKTINAGIIPGYPGIDADENGTLRIDPAALADSLAGKRTETVRFIQDFGNTLQERIRYDFNPLAGAYIGGERTDGIIEAAKKQGTAGREDDKEKTALEKRLNEVQMLLKSSYELKDLFLTVTSDSQPEDFDEAD